MQSAGSFRSVGGEEVCEIAQSILVFEDTVCAYRYDVGFRIAALIQQNKGVVQIFDTLVGNCSGHYNRRFVINCIIGIYGFFVNVKEYAEIIAFAADKSSGAGP